MILLRQTSGACSNWQLHGDYAPATIVICGRALRRAAESTIRGGDMRGPSTFAICSIDGYTALRHEQVCRGPGWAERSGGMARSRGPSAHARNCATFRPKGGALAYGCNAAAAR